ncbi:MAG: hypothetical protein JWQ40_1501 [Segetibacter sp.]|nr:hypothetical protein [Segetibacter sp.]
MRHSNHRFEYQKKAEFNLELNVKFVLQFLDKLS